MTCISKEAKSESTLEITQRIPRAISIINTEQKKYQYILVVPVVPVPHYSARNCMVTYSRATLLLTCWENSKM